jgi:hypothetical protein
MAVDQSKSIDYLRQDLQVLEEKLNSLVFDFANETGVPVYVGIENSENKQLGSDVEITQRIRVSAVITV